MEVSYHEEESAEKIHNRLRDIRTTDVGNFRYIEKLLLKLCKVINRSMKPETITNYKAYFQCKQLGSLEMKKNNNRNANDNNNNNVQGNSSLDATEIESMT